MVLHTLFLVFLILLLRESSPFIQKKETVCHSNTTSCRHAQLACDAGQRLAVLGLSRAYHLNISAFDQCLSSLQNCSAIPEGCCQPLKPPLVCEEDYSLELLEEAYVNCSAQLPRSGHENVSCALDLPAAPEPSSGKCRKSPTYRNLSSYSVVDYACIYESDVVQFCNASRRTGNLLYTIWTLGESHPYRNDVNVTSCRCSVTAAPGSPSEVFVRALDVRIPRSDVTKDCSRVTITDSVTTRLNTTCGNKTRILFDTSPELSAGATAARSPVDVYLSLHPNSLPAVVWIGFKGLGSHNLTLTCFDAGRNLSREKTPRPLTIMDADDSLPPIPAAIGGAVAGMVFIIIIGFICFHFISKRKQSSKKFKPPTWWERTREEDRLAQLSQLGPASHVNLDSGRHMGYGKHPPSRRSYPTSDTNPPIYVVTGSAVPQEDADFVEDEGIDMDSRRSSNEHPGIRPRRASGAMSNMAALGNHFPEPSVRYTVSRDGEEPQSVVIVNDGSKVRMYEIPPLTVTEIE